MKSQERKNEALGEKRSPRPLIYRIFRFVYRKIPLSGDLRYPLRTFIRGFFSDEKRVSYNTWIKLTRTFCQSDRTSIEKKIQSSNIRPTLSLLVFTLEGIPLGFPRLVDSLLAQLYPGWELLIISSPETNLRFRSNRSAFSLKALNPKISRSRSR